MSAPREVWWVEGGLFSPPTDYVVESRGAIRYLRADLLCGMCVKQGVGFRGPGEMCSHAVSTDNRHLPGPDAPACMKIRVKQ